MITISIIVKEFFLQIQAMVTSLVAQIQSC